jgi:hypothetical protein
MKMSVIPHKINLNKYIIYIKLTSKSFSYTILLFLLS